MFKIIFYKLNVAHYAGRDGKKHLSKVPRLHLDFIDLPLRIEHIARHRHSAWISRRQPMMKLVTKPMLKRKGFILAAHACELRRRINQLAGNDMAHVERTDSF